MTDCETRGHIWDGRVGRDFSCEKCGAPYAPPPPPMMGVETILGQARSTGDYGLLREALDGFATQAEVWLSTRAENAKPGWMQPCITAAREVLASTPSPDASNADDVIEGTLPSISEGSGWLIETDFGPHIHYIGLCDPHDYWREQSEREDSIVGRRALVGIIKFCRDANDACRFARKEDAQQLVDALGRLLVEPRICEHAFLSRRSPPEACPSCHGLNLSCPDGCGRDPETGELNGTRYAPPDASPADDVVEAKSISVAEEWSAYMDEAVSNAPEPLRKLGEYLASLLDEDDWKTAERFLNAAVLSRRSPPEALAAAPVDGGEAGQ